MASWNLSTDLSLELQPASAADALTGQSREKEIERKPRRRPVLTEPSADDLSLDLGEDENGPSRHQIDSLA